MSRKPENIQNKSQLELSLERPRVNDRNFDLGGRSFYFFDFDDNVAYLSTPIIIFHKKTGEEVHLSSGHFANENKNIGNSGVFKDYFMDFNDESGTFRNFRDKKFPIAQKVFGKKQKFLQDIKEALNQADHHWKAPSWQSFYHATYNQRPTSVITARGHDPETIKDGINLMVRDGHLTQEPNYLSIYPVSNKVIRKELGDHELTASVAELKKGAIRQSVDQALKTYGYSDHHRFGMSDDDEGNIELITEEMMELKSTYPDMSFFVIQTFHDSFKKMEVLQHRTRDIISRKESKRSQLNLF